MNSKCLQSYIFRLSIRNTLKSWKINKIHVTKPEFICCLPFEAISSADEINEFIMRWRFGEEKSRPCIHHGEGELMSSFDITFRACASGSTAMSHICSRLSFKYTHDGRHTRPSFMPHHWISSWIDAALPFPFVRNVRTENVCSLPACVCECVFAWIGSAYTTLSDGV